MQQLLDVLVLVRRFSHLEYSTKSDKWTTSTNKENFLVCYLVFFLHLIASIHTNDNEKEKKAK